MKRFLLLIPLFILLFISVLNIYVFALNESEPVYNGTYPYWVRIGYLGGNDKFAVIIRSEVKLNKNDFKFGLGHYEFDTTGKGGSYSSCNLIMRSYSDGWPKEWDYSIQRSRSGGNIDSSNMLGIVAGNYPIDGLFIPIPDPAVQVLIGDTELRESNPESDKVINYIDGYDSIKMFWTNQKNKQHNFSMYAIKKGFLGIESTVNIDDITSYTDEYLYNLTSPNIDYTYKLMVEDESSPYTVFDGFTGKTRFYYFKFNTLVKPIVRIEGAVNNSTVSKSPVITVTKENTTKQYDLYVNGNKIYTFSQSAIETYRVNSDVFNLGHNTVAVYDGIQLVKGLDFEIKPSGSGSDGTGEVIPPNGEDGPPPIDEYEPPSVSEGKPEPPSIEDPYSDWIYYYLEVIIYWLSLPFKMLVNLLKGLQTNVIDGISSFINSYKKMFESTKLMFSFLPVSVWTVISFGFGLSMFLWFFRARRS